MTPPSDSRRREARLLLELGRGGMGVVYLALAQGPGGFAKLKVIKRLRPDLASEPRAVRMFLDEARISSRLQHPNIVQTNEVGFDGKHYFLEMEYLEGQSYDVLVRKAGEGNLPLPLAIWVLTQALSGLHYAHELRDLDGTPLKLVHRDVSPHNVFVTYDGQVKLLDFGIAKAADSSSDTTTGGVKGKATYMAPEQAGRKTVDRRADVFAVGVMLWQAITGRRLWGELGDFEIFLKLQDEDVPSPRTAKPDAPDELCAICEKALARDPDARFATAAEMQAALEAYLEKTDARAGQKQLAKRMDELFAARRAEVKAEIEAQIKDGASGVRTFEVPALGDAALASTTSHTGTSNTIGGGDAPGSATVRRRAEVRGLRRMIAIAIGVAVIASGVVAATLAVRAKGKNAVATASASAGPPRECEKNAQCVGAHGGAPWICRKDDGRCVALETEDCKVLAEPGDVENDATVWFGTMFPLTGPKGEDGKVDANAVDLGRRDFMQIARGLPDPSGKLPARPLALVSCDDATNAERAARHLVDDVHVPAIIGFGSSQELIDLATSLFGPTRTLAIAAHNMSPLITSLSQPAGVPRLVWRTALSSSVYMLPVSLIVPTIVEPGLRARGITGPKAPMRVAVLRPSNTAAMTSVDVIFEHVRFNGKSALENGDDFRQFTFKDADADAPKIVTEMLEFAPHVVIFDGGAELVAPYFRPLEERWPSRLTFRPFYVSEGSLRGEETFAWLGSSAERRHRVYGVAPPSQTVANAKLTMRYNEVYTPKITGDLSPGGAYDAIYLLAYAASVADEMTGPAISRAIARLLPPGKPFEVGPTRILSAFQELRSGANIDLAGTNTRLDFDLATGESTADLVVLCVGVDARGRAINGIESGVVYDSQSGTLRGALACP